MSDIKVKDLTGTTTVNVDNKLMVLTDASSNVVKNISVENLLTSVLSTDSDNVLQQDVTGKLIVENPENITGDLSNLSTTDKSSLVSAINENFSNIGNLKDLSNLSNVGNNRLHALKGYLDEGELLTDAEGLADVKNYAHSTFDESKFTKSSGWSGTITKDGIASGFSSSNQLGVYLTFSPTKQLKYTCKFKTSSNLSSWQRIVDFTNNNTGSTLYNGIGINSSGYLAFEKGTTPLYTSDYAMSPNTEYIAELEWIYGTGYIGRIIKNGVKQEFELGVAPAMIGSNSLLNIGQRSGSAPFEGDIDLKQFSVTVDGVPVFCGNQTGIDTIKANDYGTTGSPVVSSDGIASGFSNSNYLTKSINISGNKLSFRIKFKTNDVTSTSSQELIRSNYFVILLGNGSSFIPRVRWGTSNENLWTSMSDQVLQANQWYIFEGELDNVTHDWKLSLYNATTSTLLQTLPGTLSGTATLPSSNITITIGKGSLTPFSGSIDLNSLTLYVNDDIKWQACLKIPYTQSAEQYGSKIVDSIYRDRVIDAYEQGFEQRYYTLQEDKKGNYQVVGSPTISSNFVASGFSTSNYISNAISIPTASHIEVIACISNIASSTTNNRVLYSLVSGATVLAELRFTGTGASFGVIGAETATTRKQFASEILTKKYIKLDYYNGTINIFTGDSLDDLTAISQNPITGVYDLAIDKVNIGISYGNTLPFDDGSIDLNAFKIYVDNELAYEAVINPNFTLPMGELYGFIEKAKGNLSVPAYGNQDIGVTIATETFTYTCPDDGYIYCNNIQVSAGGAFELSISRNGQSSYLISFGGISVDSSVQIPFIYPVKNGDVVQTYMSSAFANYPILYFVPKEGV